MGEIYKKADETISWLGPVGAETKAFKKRYAVLGLASDAVRDLSKGRINFRKGNIGDDHLLRLKNRSYFTRIWVAQEVALSSSVTLRCGNFSIEWQWWADIAASRLNHDEYHGTNQIENDAISNFSSLEGFAKNIQGNRITKVFRKVYCPNGKLITWHCQNDVDKVYALMGMVAPEHRLKVDYSKDVSALFPDLLDDLLDGMFEEIVKAYGSDLDWFLSWDYDREGVRQEFAFMIKMLDDMLDYVVMYTDTIGLERPTIGFVRSRWYARLRSQEMLEGFRTRIVEFLHWDHLTYDQVRENRRGELFLYKEKYCPGCRIAPNGYTHPAGFPPEFTR